MPLTSSLKATPLFRWLALHLKYFLPSLWRAFRWHPAGVARAASAAFAQAFRARRFFISWPRKVYLKEFLQAAMLADWLRQAPEVRHIHAHFCHGSTTVAWLASLITTIPFSFTAHAKDLYSPSLNPAGLLRRKMDAAQFVTTCTETNRKFLEQQGSATPVYAIYHGLNADFVDLLRKHSTARSTDRRLRVLAVGRLTPKKGFDVLVEACVTLRRLGVSFDAAIVGESGEHEKEVRARIAKHRLTRRVRLLGPMPQSRLYEEYRRATVFCLPCRILSDGDRDGIPNVMLEAMALGVPVISTNVSGIPEAVQDGINGILIPPNDPQALANAILRLQRDPELAARISHAAQATIREHFDADHFAARMAGLLRECVA